MRTGIADIFCLLFGSTLTGQGLLSSLPLYQELLQDRSLRLRLKEPCLSRDWLRRHSHRNQMRPLVCFGEYGRCVVLEMRDHFATKAGELDILFRTLVEGSWDLGKDDKRWMIEVKNFQYLVCQKSSLIGLSLLFICCENISSYKLWNNWVKNTNNIISSLLSRHTPLLI